MKLIIVKAEPGPTSLVLETEVTGRYTYIPRKGEYFKHLNRIYRVLDRAFDYDQDTMLVVVEDKTP